MVPKRMDGLRLLAGSEVDSNSRCLTLRDELAGSARFGFSVSAERHGRSRPETDWLRALMLMNSLSASLS